MKKINRDQIRKLILKEMFGGMFSGSSSNDGRPLASKDYEGLKSVDGDLSVHKALTTGRFGQNLLDAIRREVARAPEFLAELDAIEAQNTSGYLEDEEIQEARARINYLVQISKNWENDILESDY